MSFTRFLINFRLPYSINNPPKSTIIKLFIIQFIIHYSLLYSITLSFEFKLRSNLEKNYDLTIEVEGKNKIKDNILASLYKVKVKFFVPYFNYYSEEYNFKEILKPDEQYTTKYTMKIPQIQMPGFYAIFGTFTMEDVNAYPISNVTYTILKYGDTSKLFLSTPNIEINCSNIKSNSRDDEEVCFDIVEKHTLKINISIPPPISEYLKESGLHVITQPELNTINPLKQQKIYKFFDREKKTIPFVFTDKSALHNSKYIFYVYSYIDYTGVDDIYHIENITFKYLKKVPRKIFEYSLKGCILLLSTIFTFLFLIFNLPFINKRYLKLSTATDYILLFAIFFVIYSYLFSLIPLSKSYFHPDTPYVAGDNATHYNLAKIVKEWNIGKFIINGWDNSHFSGYKIFQTYFPLPFILIAILSFFINFNIAFKIVHISGTFMLPLALFIAGRLFGFNIHASTLLSILSLLFLVLSSYNNTFILWGGNFTSTLAGEFCFSFSFTFFVLYCGLLYRAINSDNKKKYLILLIVLEVFTGLSHAFTMLYILFFLILLFTNRNITRNNLSFVFIQQIISLMLMAWWLIPTLAYKDYTFSQWYENWPKDMFLHNNVLSLAAIVAVLLLFSMTFWNGWLTFIKRYKTLLHSIIGLFLLGILANYMAYPLGVADIRFFPLTLLALIILAGLFFEFFTSFFHFRLFLCTSILFLVLWLVSTEENVVKVWSKFNGKGLKFLNYYDYFHDISETLKGSFNDGRVITDKSGIYEPFGSPLVLTLLPHYSKRQVLDGMDYRSSASSFFAFDFQTSISGAWGSYPDGYKFSSLDLKMAKKRAKVLNVQHFIIADTNNIPKFYEDKDFNLVKQIGPFHIFNLKNIEHKYVEPLLTDPILVATNNWKVFSYRWFKNPKLINYPVIFIRNKRDYIEARRYFSRKIYIPHDEKELISKKLNISNDEIINFVSIPEKGNKNYDNTGLFIDENVTNDRIEINVNKTHVPLFVKISYHPNLKIIGADYIYFSTPSFFIISPKENKVKIYLGYNLLDILSIALFYIGLTIITLLIIYRKNPTLDMLTINISNYLTLPVWILSIVLVTFLFIFPLYRILAKLENIKSGARNANTLLSEAQTLMYSHNKEDNYKAKEKLAYILENYKNLGFLDEVLYKYAEVHFKLENLSATNNTIEQIFKMFPESIYYGHALILWAKLYEKMGTDENIATAKILYQLAVKDFPDTEIENLASSELQKYEKKQPQIRTTKKQFRTLQRILNKLEDIEKDNLQFLLQSKEFRKLLQIHDKKLLNSIINNLKKKEGK